MSRRSAKFYSNGIDEFVRRGLDYFDAKDWNRAVGEFDKALSVDPKNKIAQQKREEALSQSGIQQLSLFGPETHPLVDEIKELDVDSLSPLEALNKLYELKQKAGE